MQLLVSVINELEVSAAIEGGADIVDVKNPREGSLGANFPHVIRRVRELTPPKVAVSAVIGDVPNLPGTVALAALGAATCGVQYIKVGLLGPKTRQDVVYMLQQIRRAVKAHDPAIQIIATTYADAHKVGALPPLQLPAAAIEAGVDGCLLDTIRKGEGTLFTHLNFNQLQSFAAECHQANLLCGLAGSLGRVEDIEQVCRLGTDVMGVRGAICRDNLRDGQIDRQKVANLKALMAECVSPLSGPSPAIRPNVPAALH